MAVGKFTRAAAQLLRVLGEARSAIVGGLAVNAHGYIRATRDVDIITSLPLGEARRRLREHGIEARLFRGDPLEGGFECLKGILPVGPRPTDVVPFDVLPPLEPVTPDRTIEVVVRGQRLRVVDGDTLVKLKLQAGGPKDLYDVAMLVGLHPDWEERAVALASRAGTGVAGGIVAMLRDPRVRAQAREVARQDSALRAFARRRARGRRDRR
jgi:hypothetical protein